MRLIVSLVILFTTGQLSAQTDFIPSKTSNGFKTYKTIGIKISNMHMCNNFDSNWNTDAQLSDWNSKNIHSRFSVVRKTVNCCLVGSDRVNIIPSVEWSITDVDLVKITPKFHLASLTDVSSTFEVTNITAPIAMANRLASLVVTSDAIFPFRHQKKYRSK